MCLSLTLWSLTQSRKSVPAGEAQQACQACQALLLKEELRPTLREVYRSCRTPSNKKHVPGPNPPGPSDGSCKMNSSSLHISSPLAAWFWVLPTPVVLWTSYGFGGSPLPVPQVQAIETLRGPWVEVFLCIFPVYSHEVVWQTCCKHVPKLGLDILKLQCRARRHLLNEKDKKDMTIKHAQDGTCAWCQNVSRSSSPEQLGYFLPHTSHTVIVVHTIN